MYKFLGGHKFSFLLDRYLRVELLGHTKLFQGLLSSLPKHLPLLKYLNCLAPEFTHLANRAT